MNDITLTDGISINQAIDAKSTKFEEIINKIPGVTVQKRILGKDQSGKYDMLGYVISPKGYTLSGAITAHVHGNEKINPAGIMAIFQAMSKTNADDTICFLRDNVRWIVMFMCNPYGYAANTRMQSRGVNINRNHDYSWLHTTSEENTKGQSPISEAETKAIVDFFTPYKAELDFHVDSHDVTMRDSAYNPATNWHCINEDYLAIQRADLEKRNAVDVSTLRPYTNPNGSTTNFFSDVLGVTSVTSEAASDYWTVRGYSDAETILQSGNMSLCFIIGLINFVMQRKSATEYYNRLGCCAFRSSQYALNTWSDGQIIEACSRTGWLMQDEGGFKSFMRVATNRKRATILLVSDNQIDNIGKLTALRYMAELDEAKDHWLMLKRLTQVADIIVAPICNNTQSLITKYQPNFVIQIDQSQLDKSEQVTVKTNGFKNVTPFMRDNYKIVYDDILGDGIYKIILNNPKLVNEPDRYGYIVVQWISALLNISSSLVVTL